MQIQQNGDLYTSTDNVCAQIVVDRDKIVIDGAGDTPYVIDIQNKTAIR